MAAAAESGSKPAVDRAAQLLHRRFKVGARCTGARAARRWRPLAR